MRHFRSLSPFLLLLSSAVFIIGCGGGGPSGPITLPTVVNDNVTVLPASVTFSAVGADGTITLNGTGIPSLKVGDIVVSGSGDGLLRRVTGTPVTREGTGNSVQVPTVQATLEDAFEQVEVQYAKTLGPDDIAHITNLAEGVTVLPDVKALKSGVHVTKSFSLLNVAIAPGVSASGTIGVSLDVDLQMRVKDGHLQYFRCAPTASATSTCTVNAGATLVSISRKLPLCEMYGAPITVDAGAMPLVFTPKLTIYATFDGKAEVGAQWPVSATVTFTGGVEYSDGWHVVTRLSHDITAPSGFFPVISGEASAQVCLTDTNASLMLYGVAGPYVEVRSPYVEGIWRYNSDAVAKMTFDLRGGVDGHAGAKVTVFGDDLVDYSATLFDWSASLPGYPRTAEGGVDVTVH